MSRAHYRYTQLYNRLVQHKHNVVVCITLMGQYNILLELRGQMFLFRIKLSLPVSSVLSCLLALLLYISFFSDLLISDWPAGFSFFLSWFLSIYFSFLFACLHAHVGHSQSALRGYVFLSRLEILCRSRLGRVGKMALLTLSCTAAWKCDINESAALCRCRALRRAGEEPCLL